jgi:FkbM family methyltransferase
MISYAQNFEDVMLSRVFRDRKGFYVDVGSGDPVNLSVTKWFYDLGWHGINIEPHSGLYNRLVAQRSRDINLGCGAGNARQEARFYELPTMEWSSFDADVQRRATARDEPVTERIVKVLSLNEILDKHGQDLPIDFLKIDVEGCEHEVLKGIDLRRYRPSLIVVEATRQGTTELTHQTWEHLLTAADFQPVYFDGVNRYYLPLEKMDLAKHFAVPPNTCDDFVLAETARLRAELGSLRGYLHESESDRAARGAQIETLSLLLQECEADRVARFGQIQKLTKWLQDSEAERTARSEQVIKLDAWPRESRTSSAKRSPFFAALSVRLRQLINKLSNGRLARNNTKPIEND